MSDQDSLLETIVNTLIGFSIAISILTCLVYITIPLWFPHFVRCITKHQQDLTTIANTTSTGNGPSARQQTAPGPVIAQPVRHSLPPPLVGPLPPFSARDFFGIASPYNQDRRVAAEAGFVRRSGEVTDTLPRDQLSRASSPIVSLGYWV